uniref:Auxin-responsive protein n=1 Tax=Oryza punctata TaxID=4537 RepID=A0A0E0LXR5_ORYPU
MISSKKLAQLSKKWQGMGAIGRKRVTASEKEIIHHSSCSSSVAGKGNCVVYSCDGRRFEIPLAYLRTPVFVELLRMSQEEFGFSSDGRITLPCDTAVMEYVMCLLGREASEEVEKALLSSIVMPCSHHPSRMAQQPLNQHFAVCSI